MQPFFGTPKDHHFCPACQKKQIAFDHVCPDCNKPHQFHQNHLHGNNRSHANHHCPHCHNQKQPEHHCPHCDEHHDHCIQTCEHPIIFDKRILVDEHVMHHGHMNFNQHCSNCHHQFICDDRFRIRLAGLDGGMAFRLRELLDVEAKFEIAGEQGSKMLKGRVCSIGSDFVEVVLAKKAPMKKPVKRLRRTSVKKKAITCKKDEFRIIPFDSIKSVTFADQQCC